MPAERSSNRFEVKVGGNAIASEHESALLEATVEDEVNLPDSFELVFRDPNRSVLADAGFEIGKPVTISVVSEESPEGKPIVDGEITALEADFERDQTRTIVRGYDAAHRLQRGTTTETHLDVTYGDIAAKVAERRGLERGDAGTSTVVHEAVVQWNQTDWEFLSSLADEIGHEVVVADGKLHLRAPGDAADGPDAGDAETDSPRQLVAGSNILRLRATVSGAEQVEEVHVRGWDVVSKEAVEAQVPVADTARSASAGSGSASLARELNGGTLVKADLPVTSQEVAQATAESLVERLGSAAVELDGVVQGNPELRAGVTVSLANAGQPFDGTYTLTSCRHTYDPAHGYLTAFRVCGRQNRTMLGLVRGAGATRNRDAAGVVPAIVTNVDDPLGLGRLKVVFPWLTDRSESHWARVAMTGAGNERGFVMLPEVGDEVLVAFEHGDPRMPYVIGGLYNGKDKLPVEPVEGGKIVRRTAVSRNGHRWELDDDGDKVTIATGDGDHRIVLDQQAGKILLETSGDVEINSRSALAVSASNGLTFESSGSLELKANGITIDAQGGAFSAKGAQAKVEGTGTAELTSSGQTTVRGSLVKIN